MPPGKMALGGDDLDLMYMMFKKYDTDGSGDISMEELEAVFKSLLRGKKVQKGFIDDQMANADKDGDGTLTFNEYCFMITSKKDPRLNELKKNFDGFDVDVNGRIQMDQLHNACLEAAPACGIEEKKMEFQFKKMDSKKKDKVTFGEFYKFVNGTGLRDHALKIVRGSGAVPAKKAEAPATPKKSGRRSSAGSTSSGGRRSSAGDKPSGRAPTTRISAGRGRGSGSTGGRGRGARGRGGRAGGRGRGKPEPPREPETPRGLTVDDLEIVYKLFQKADRGEGEISYSDVVGIFEEMVYNGDINQEFMDQQLASGDFYGVNAENEFITFQEYMRMQCGLDEFRVTKIKNNFESFGPDINGWIDPKALKDVVMGIATKFNVDMERVNLELSRADRNGDGHISFAEFYKLCTCSVMDQFCLQVKSQAAMKAGAALEAMGAAGARGEGGGTEAFGGLTVDDLDMLYTMFVKADTDKSGGISNRELKAIFKGLVDAGKLTQDQVSAKMKSADLDGDGQISFYEYVQMQTGIEEPKITKIKQNFESFRPDDDGKIEVDILAGICYIVAEDYGMDASAIEESAFKCDLNGDGSVSYAEFYKLCTGDALKKVCVSLKRTPQREGRRVKRAMENATHNRSESQAELFRAEAEKKMRLEAERKLAEYEAAEKQANAEEERLEKEALDAEKIQNDLAALNARVAEMERKEEEAARQKKEEERRASMPPPKLGPTESEAEFGLVDFDGGGVEDYGGGLEDFDDGGLHGDDDFALQDFDGPEEGFDGMLTFDDDPVPGPPPEEEGDGTLDHLEEEDREEEDKGESLMASLNHLVGKFDSMANANKIDLFQLDEICLMYGRKVPRGTGQQVDFKTYIEALVTDKSEPIRKVKNLNRLKQYFDSYHEAGSGSLTTTTLKAAYSASMGRNIKLNPKDAADFDRSPMRNVKFSTYVMLLVMLDGMNMAPKPKTDVPKEKKSMLVGAQSALDLKGDRDPDLRRRSSNTSIGSRASATGSVANLRRGTSNASVASSGSQRRDSVASLADRRGSAVSIKNRSNSNQSLRRTSSNRSDRSERSRRSDKDYDRNDSRLTEYTEYSDGSYYSDDDEYYEEQERLAREAEEKARQDELAELNKGLSALNELETKMAKLSKQMSMNDDSNANKRLSRGSRNSTGSASSQLGDAWKNDIREAEAEVGANIAIPSKKIDVKEEQKQPGYLNVLKGSYDDKVKKEGALTQQGLFDCAKRLGVSQDFLSAAKIKNIVKSNGGSLRFQSFVRALIVDRLNPIIDLQHLNGLYDWFNTYDVDRNGTITLEELFEVFEKQTGGPVPEDMVQGMHEAADANGDGVIDFEEYVYMMQMDGLQLKEIAKIDNTEQAMKERNSEVKRIQKWMNTLIHNPAMEQECSEECLGILGDAEAAVKRAVQAEVAGDKPGLLINIISGFKLVKEAATGEHAPEEMCAEALMKCASMLKEFGMKTQGVKK